MIGVKTFIICLFVLLAQAAQGSIIDAPHNETYQVRCGSCHPYSLWWQYSPSTQNLTPDHNTIVDTVCMVCHDEAGSAPLAKTHSAIVMGSTTYHSGDWTMGCADCHNPHYQDQLNWVGTGSEPFLITGTIDNVSPNTPADGQTLITYSGATTDANWPAVGGEAEDLDWARKNNSDRGLVFVHDATDVANTYGILSATNTQIVILGLIDPTAVDPAEQGNPATCNTFGLIYGQLIRNIITTPYSGSKNVKFFDSNGGFADDNEEGVCQVCHTETKHFRNTGEINVGVTDFDHIGQDAENCMPCHGHNKGFVHGGGTGPGCGSTTECHGLQDSHPAHVDPGGTLGADCARCHDTNNFPQFTKDKAILCAECHDDGTGTPSSVPEWGGVTAPQCSECHAVIPSTGSHPVHLANTGVSCDDCHENTEQGTTPPAQHLDSNIDVYDITAGDLGYTVDKAKGIAYSTCSGVSCHGAGTPLWGGTVACEDCHLGANDVDDYIFSSFTSATLAVISSTEWAYSGHGKTADSYDISANPAANLPGAANGESPCLYCHDASVVHGVGTNPFRLANTNALSNGDNDNCLICHGTAGTGFDPDDGGAMTLKNATVKIDKYHYGADHGIGNDGGSLCWDCHDPHGDRTAGNGNIFMVHTDVVKEKSDAYGTPSATGAPVFTANVNGSDYAKTGSPYDGICQVCHTKTSYYTAASGNNGHSTNKCIGCHSHGDDDSVNQYAFNHGGGAGDVSTCQECHGHDEGYGGFTGGKGTYVAHSTHTENDLDDLRGPSIVCGSCHDANNIPFFATGTDGNGDGKYSLSETDVCDTCHSSAGTYDGVGDSELGAKNNWSSVGSSNSQIYAADGSLQVGKEKWCATCHDEQASEISGITAPNVVGGESGAYIYGTGYGYYKTGHGLATDEAFPSSGGVAKGAGLDCDACHDFSSSHIDGDARTYAAQSPDIYRTGYRLKQVDLGSGSINPMHLPWPQNDSTIKERFALCSSCHDEQPLLGQNNDTNLMHSGVNYHSYHIGMSNIRMDSDWDGALDSRINCTVCHNVHGSQRLAMMRDGSLIGREPGFEVWYANSSLVNNVSGNATLPDPQDLTLIRSTGMIMLETSSVRMCSACHNRGFTSQYSSGALRWKGDSPALDWTREPYYWDRGIHSDRLFNTTETVPFRVMYFDPNNNAPSTIQLWIDHNDNGTYETGEKTAMTADDPGDATYTDGKIYKADVSLTNPGDKAIIYRVYATDGVNVAVGQPALNQVIEWDNNFIRDVPSEYSGIQDAIDNAYDGNTILVADGAYNENLDYLGKDLIIQSVNGAAATSILGSGIDNPVVALNNSEPSTAVLDGFTINNVNSGTYYNMTGIRITNGATPIIKNNIITGNSNRGKGAGIMISSGAATIENCTIDGNTTSFQTGAGVHIENATAITTFTNVSISSNTSKTTGGGLYVASSDVTLTNVTIDNNRSNESSGGGVYITGDVDAIFTGGSISSNQSKYSGAGLYFNGGGAGSLSISGLTIDSNVNNTTTTSNGGGVYLGNIGSTSTITNTSISSNTVKSTGGGIYLNNAPVTLSGCTINSNNVYDKSAGGIWSNSSMTIQNCDISSNTINHSPDRGGGLDLSGASSVVNISDTTIEGNRAPGSAGIDFSGLELNIVGGTISNNTGTAQLDGGGLYATNGTVSLTGTSVVGNKSGHGGGGIFCSVPVSVTNCIISGNATGGNYWAKGGGVHGSPATVMNSTIVGNRCVRDGGGVNAGGGTVINSIVWNNSAGGSGSNVNSATVSYSNLSGSGYTNGGNNISTDPLFIDGRSYSEAPTTEGDYHLLNASPVKNQATSAGAPSDDIDGDARPQEGGYDMGADEY